MLYTYFDLPTIAHGYYNVDDLNPTRYVYLKVLPDDSGNMYSVNPEFGYLERRVNSSGRLAIFLLHPAGTNMKLQLSIFNTFMSPEFAAYLGFGEYIQPLTSTYNFAEYINEEYNITGIHYINMKSTTSNIPEFTMLVIESPEIFSEFPNILLIITVITLVLPVVMFIRRVRNKTTIRMKGNNLR